MSFRWWQKRKEKEKKTQHPIHLQSWLFFLFLQPFENCVKKQLKLKPAPQTYFSCHQCCVLPHYFPFKYRQHNWDPTSCCNSQSGLPEMGISHLSRKKNQTASLHQTRLATSEFKLFSVPTEAEVFFICFPNTHTHFFHFCLRTLNPVKFYYTTCYTDFCFGTKLIHFRSSEGAKCLAYT